jgi:hypothetical protein
MRWIILTLIGALTFGNGLGAEPENLTAPATECPDLDISVIADSDTKLSVHYTFKNTLEHGIYVFTPILTYDKKQKKRLPDPGRMYVSWHADTKSSTVRVSKQLWPIPGLVCVYEPEVPHLMLLAPGDVLEEDLSFEMPLKIDYPYMSVFNKKKPGVSSVQTFAHAIVFAVGYVSGGPKELRLEPTTEGTFTIPYGIGITHQKIAERKVDTQVSVVE